MKEACILLCGALSLLVAVFHLLFWRLFGWPERLKGSGHINAAITQVMNIMLIYVFVAYGVALLWLGPQASALLLVAGAGFIVTRLALQPLMFGLEHAGSMALMAAGLAGLAAHLVVLFA